MAIDGDNGRTSTVGGGNTGYNWSGYAEWLAKTKNSTKTCNLIVNYYANGYNGSAAENPPPSSVRSYTGQSVDVRLVVEVASGDTMSNPGYVFVGWATSNNTPTITYNPGDTISNSWAAGYRGNSVTNLYAVWTNQNVITYNPDDNSIEKSAIYQVKQSGQSATLKGATFTRTGYTQTGWATTAGGPKVYNLGGTYSSNNPLSLYPVWQANTYTITYVANEGTGTMADQTVTYDSTFTPRACSFTREGYSFSSWNESQDGKGIRWKVQEYTVDRAENITLYAIWKGNEYTVYYDDNYSRYSDEITGDVVTFESEYAQPLKKAEVSLSPIQDLHGYDSPWVGTEQDKVPYNFRALPDPDTTEIGNSEIGKIVGGTVAWNQLVVEGKTLSQNFSVRNGTLTVGTDYATYTASSASTLVAVVTTTQTPKVLNSKFIVNFDIYPATSKNVRMWLVDYSANTSILRSVTAAKWNNVSGVLNVNSANNLREIQLQLNCTEVGEEDKLKNVSVYNLTQMFGSTIADYIYGLEQNTAGAGVAWFRKLFPKDYYAYDAGSLLSVKTSAHKEYGFNAYDNSTGKAKVVGGQVYQITGTYTALSLDGSSITPDASGYFTPAASGEITVTGGNATDTCIHLKWDGERDGEYEPYEEHTYPLDDVELRGIPKLDANNNLYYDGDSYAPDGTVTRKYGIVDLGTLTWSSWNESGTLLFNAVVPNKLNSRLSPCICHLYSYKTVVSTWSTLLDKEMTGIVSSGKIYIRDSEYSSNEAFATAMSGVYLVYELATPTTESADPYTSPQSVSPYGTEEYVDAGVAAGTRDVAIPVGHETTFANICPISGRTGVDVYRTGKNLVDANTVWAAFLQPDGTFYHPLGNVYFYIPQELVGKQLTFSAYAKADAGGANLRVRAVINGTGNNGNLINNTTGYSLTELTFTPTSTSDYIILENSGINGTYKEIQLELGSTATTYEPYTGNTYAVDWTTEAGTVYGGTLDVVTGVLTVTRKMLVADGTQTVAPSQSNRFYITASDAKAVNASNQTTYAGVVCDRLPSKTWAGLTNEGIGCSPVWGHGIAFKNPDITTAADWKTYFTNNPTQFSYELATPLTYQLTATQIEALVGTNNVWSDGGPITIVYALDEVPQNMPPSTAIFGDIFYTRRNQLSRFGLTFKGWNTVPDGSGEAWLPSGVSMGTYKRTEDAVWNVSHNVTLYAQWDPNVYPFGTVFFNGRNAQDLGIIVEELPSYYYAERAFNHKQVNGKNGDVILDTGRYENVKKVYKVACYDPSRNFYESAVALSTFLHSAGSDYIRLEDSYEPSSYRMAIYEETNEIENLLGKAGRCEITFNCMPQRFLLSGDEEITIPSSGYSIYNPTAFDAKPMIRIQGTGTVTINGRSVQVTENDNDMLVDCENQNAKDLSGADMNYFIYCDEFPILKPGFNTISYTETIDAVKITPRWWIL